ncbi:MAG TPA: glycosyltransferase family 2 protein [Caulobacteraceae bacterium]|nr:glycosyltransferase family 2 protein [Caulobacteraceae bacterium]
MTPTPLVSVVIPHYNRVAVLGETLRTVLAQTYPHWEVVIVDDCSPQDPREALAEFLADPRIRLVRLEANGGASAARNVGIGEATGDLIAFLDSDDHWRPQKLEKQVALAVSAPDPERVIVTTLIEKHGATATTFEPSRGVAPGESFDHYLFLNGGIAQTSSVMTSRSAALAIGFDARLRQFEDYLFFLKAGGLGLTHLFVPEPMVIWQDDYRPDRLSRGSDRNMTNAWLFLEGARDVLDERSRLVFLTNHVGALYMRQHPLRASLSLARAASLGVISPARAVRVAINGLLPQALKGRLKQMAKVRA